MVVQVHPQVPIRFQPPWCVDKGLGKFHTAYPNMFNFNKPKSAPWQTAIEKLIELLFNDLLNLNQRITHMSAALDKLTADVADLTTAVNALIAQASAPADDLTAVTASVEALTASVNAVLTPAATTPAPSA